MTVGLWKSPEAEPTGSGVGREPGPCFSVAGGPGPTPGSARCPGARFSSGRKPARSKTSNGDEQTQRSPSTETPTCAVISSNTPHREVPRGPDGPPSLGAFCGSLPARRQRNGLGAPQSASGQKDGPTEPSRPPAPSGPRVSGARCQDGSGCGLVPGLQSLQSRGQVPPPRSGQAPMNSGVGGATLRYSAFSAAGPLKMPLDWESLGKKSCW